MQEMQIHEGDSQIRNSRLRLSPTPPTGAASSVLLPKNAEENRVQRQSPGDNDCQVQTSQTPMHAKSASHSSKTSMQKELREGFRMQQTNKQEKDREGDLQAAKVSMLQKTSRASRDLQVQATARCQGKMRENAETQNLQRLVPSGASWRSRLLPQATKTFAN